jgi:uncharacterized membrane protein YdbT with pleckstrin-like domain
MSQEQTVWSGTSSQILNLGTYILCILLFWMILPIFIGIWKYMVVRATKYELTTQRLRLRTGVLNKEINELELYRVKDFRIEQPLFLRLFSVSNIVILTSDSSHAVVCIRAVVGAEDLMSKIRENVEIMRRNRVREVDVN